MKKYFAVIFVGVDCSEAMKTLTFNTIELPKLIHKKPLFLRNVNIVTFTTNFTSIHTPSNYPQGNPNNLLIPHHIADFFTVN